MADEGGELAGGDQEVIWKLANLKIWKWNSDTDKFSNYHIAIFDNALPRPWSLWTIEF